MNTEPKPIYGEGNPETASINLAFEQASPRS